MPKNIVFYFSDQQRYDTVNDELTPNIMELARHGVKYENAYTCQPVCGPARACLQTGVYATQNGCYINGISLPDSMKHLADFFNEKGYDTAYIGKWHLASDKNAHFEKTSIPKARLGGYNYFRGADVLEFTSHGYNGFVFDEQGIPIEFKGYRADKINDFATEYLEKRKNNKPFFMFVSQLEPHHQNDHHRFEGFDETIGNYRKYPIPSDLTSFKGDYEKFYPDYLSAINRLDYNVGRLVEKLKELNLFEDTVIIYASDHGCHFKTRNMEYKRSCHDSSTHIPLVISGGDFKDGISDDSLVSLIDLPPTLLSIAEIEAPDYFQGYDLTKALESDIALRDCVFMQISESQCGRAIRTREYKYSVIAPSDGFLKKDSPVYFEAYLYDLRRDPDEKNNLVKDKAYSIVRKNMSKLLKREMVRAGEKKPIILPTALAMKK